MKLRSIAYVAAFFFVALPILPQQKGQTQNPPPAAAPKGPKAKSQKELAALQKVQQAAQAGNYDAEITAINEVLENFADTEYKPMLLNMAMDAAERKGDYAQTLVWGDRIMENNPKDFTAPILMAATIAQHTRENDLDKDQSLKKVDDDANKGLDLVKSAPADPPTGFNGTAADWANYKKDQTALAHYALGLAADLRKNYPEAIQDLKTSNSEATHPSPTTDATLAKVYVDAKQYDDAIATADKVLATPDAPAQVKQFAQAQKDAATKMKGAK
jgi:tetratricopeptide (TPR) repeat protein